MVKRDKEKTRMKQSDKERHSDQVKNINEGEDESDSISEDRKKTNIKKTKY